MSKDIFDLIDQLARYHNIIITDWVTPEHFKDLWPGLTEEQAIAACHRPSGSDYDDAINRDVRYEVMREAVSDD